METNSSKFLQKLRNSSSASKMHIPPKPAYWKQNSDSNGWNTEDSVITSKKDKKCIEIIDELEDLMFEAVCPPKKELKSGIANLFTKPTSTAHQLFLSELAKSHKYDLLTMYQSKPVSANCLIKSKLSSLPNDISNQVKSTLLPDSLPNKHSIPPSVPCSKLGRVLCSSDSRKRFLNTAMTSIAMDMISDKDSLKWMSGQSFIERDEPCFKKPFIFNSPEPIGFDAKGRSIIKPSVTALSYSVKSLAISDKRKLQALQSDCSKQPTKAPTTSTSINPGVIVPRQVVGKDRSILVKAHTKLISTADYKPAVKIVICGLTTSGKSTLVSTLLKNLNLVADKDLSRARWDSAKAGHPELALSWLLDQTPDERKWLHTLHPIEVACETPSKRITILDTPGFNDSTIPSLIPGVIQSDAALFVISADQSGPSLTAQFSTCSNAESGSLYDQLFLTMRWASLKQLLIVVTKMDKVKWCQAAYKRITSQVDKFIESCRGKNGHRISALDVTYCPVDCQEGLNVTSKLVDCDREVPSWYTGSTLIECIDRISPIKRDLVDSPFRFFVTDVSRPAMGSEGLAVSGCVISGAITSGINSSLAQVVYWPAGVHASVKSIRSQRTNPNQAVDFVGDVSVTHAFPGDSVTLILALSDSDASSEPPVFRQCSFITDPSLNLRGVSRIRANLQVPPQLDEPIINGHQAIFHCLSVDVPCTIKRIFSESHTTKHTKLKTVKRPRLLLKSCVAEVEICLEEPISMEMSNQFEFLQRFVLRSKGRTIAHGSATKLMHESAENS